MIADSDVVSETDKLEYAVIFLIYERYHLPLQDYLFSISGVLKVDDTQRSLHCLKVFHQSGRL